MFRTDTRQRIPHLETSVWQVWRRLQWGPEVWKTMGGWQAIPPCPTHQQDQWLFPSYLFFNTKYLHIIQKAQTGHTVTSASCSFLTHPTRLQASQLPPVFAVLPEGILHKRTGICMLFYSTHTSGSKLHTPGQLVFIKQIWAHIPHPAAKASPPF